MADEAIITLNRVQSFSGILRKYAVCIDGKKIDALASGEGKSYKVSAGQHSIEVRMDLYKSPPLQLTLAPGSMVSLVCGDSGPSSFKETYSLEGIKSIASSLIDPKNHLYIRSADIGQTSSPVDTSNRQAEKGFAGGNAGQTHIQVQRAKTSPVDKKRKLFLSYRRSDSGFLVGRLCDRLNNHYGEKNIFRDVDSIPLGVDFREHIQQTIADCDAVLAIIGPDWLEITGENGERRIDQSGDFVRVELELGLQHSLPLIPVLVKGAAMPDSQELPESIAELSFRNAFVLLEDPYFHMGVDKLINDIDALRDALNEDVKVEDVPPVVRANKFCTHCGSDRVGEYRFCIQCGTEILL